MIYTLDGLSHVRAAAARAHMRPHVVIRVAGTRAPDEMVTYAFVISGKKLRRMRKMSMKPLEVSDFELYIL